LQGIATISSTTEAELVLECLTAIEKHFEISLSEASEKKAMREEITKRMGEVATTTLALYGSPSLSPVWRTWLSRNPANQLAQLFALMGAPSSAHAKSGSQSAPSKRSTADLTVICFSKDRAFQLKEYLRSLLLYVHGPRLHVVVLYKATSAFVKSFKKLQEMFPQVEWIEEDCFANQLKVRLSFPLIKYA